MNYLASHDMRRSFATHHYDNGSSVNLIMKITGHKRESTFYEYIGRKPKKDHDAYNFLECYQMKILEKIKELEKDLSYLGEL